MEHVLGIWQSGFEYVPPNWTHAFWTIVPSFFYKLTFVTWLCYTHWQSTIPSSWGVKFFREEEISSSFFRHMNKRCLCLHKQDSFSELSQSVRATNSSVQGSNTATVFYCGSESQLGLDHHSGNLDWDLQKWVLAPVYLHLLHHCSSTQKGDNEWSSSQAQICLLRFMGAKSLNNILW